MRNTAPDEKTVAKTEAIAKPTLRRLPLYHRYLKKALANDADHVSCTHIAKNMGLTSIQVRKDLQMAGAAGKPKVGYHIVSTIAAIEEFSGFNHTKKAVIVGVGNLGSALLGYKGFKDYGLHIVEAFDKDPQVIGRTIQNRAIKDITLLPYLAQQQGVHLGIITVPAEQAAKIMHLMIRSEIKAIWNFAPIQLPAPEGVIVLNESMASSLAILSKALQRFTD